MRNILIIVLITISTLSFGLNKKHKKATARNHSPDRSQKDTRIQNDDEDSLQLNSYLLDETQNSYQEDKKPTSLTLDTITMDAGPLKSGIEQVEKYKKKKHSNPIIKKEINDATHTNTNSTNGNNTSYSGSFIIIYITIILVALYSLSIYNKYSNNSIGPDDWKRLTMSRRDYYNEVYLKSEEWQRKRYVVFKRDNWKCVFCGAAATEVHHKRYAKRNIGKEPIDWLVSICKPCHRAQHDIKNQSTATRLNNWGWEKLSEN